MCGVCVWWCGRLRLLAHRAIGPWPPIPRDSPSPPPWPSERGPHLGRLAGGAALHLKQANCLLTTTGASAVEAFFGWVGWLGVRWAACCVADDGETPAAADESKTAAVWAPYHPSYYGLARSPATPQPATDKNPAVHGRGWLDLIALWTLRLVVLEEARPNMRLSHTFYTPPPNPPTTAMDQALLQLLELLGSPDKAARQQAEAHYAQLRETSAPQVRLRKPEVGT